MPPFYRKKKWDPIPLYISQNKTENNKPHELNNSRERLEVGCVVPAILTVATLCFLFLVLKQATHLQHHGELKALILFLQ